MKYSRLPTSDSTTSFSTSSACSLARIRPASGSANSKITPYKVKRTALSSQGLKAGITCGTISTMPHIAPASPA
jgi:hypothetical protein